MCAIAVILACHATRRKQLHNHTRVYCARHRLDPCESCTQMSNFNKIWLLSRVDAKLPHSRVQYRWDMQSEKINICKWSSMAAILYAPPLRFTPRCPRVGPGRTVMESCWHCAESLSAQLSPFRIFLKGFFGGEIRIPINLLGMLHETVHWFSNVHVRFISKVQLELLANKLLVWLLFILKEVTKMQTLGLSSSDRGTGPRLWLL